MELPQSQRGQSALEVIIALAILVIVSTVSFVLLGTTLAENQEVADRAQAERLIREGFEAIRQIRNRDWDALAPGTYGLAQSGGDWTFSGGSDVTGGQFTRTVTVSDPGDEDQREIEIEIAWQATPTRPTSVAATTRLTNWQLAEPLPSSSNCRDGSLSGDWTLPITVGTADLGAGNQGTDIVVDLPYIYASGVASSSSKPDLFIFDATDLTAPTLIKSINIGSGGINALALEGDYLYAASANNSMEFMVFDVSTPASASLVTSSNLSGSNDGLTIIVKDTFVALGRDSSSSYDEIYFYDVTTPTSPTLLSTYGVPDDVNDFATSETHLFAVTSATNDDLLVFDITDPLAPTYVSTFNISDSTADLSIAYQDPGVAFVGNAGNTLMVLDVSDLSAITETETISTGGEVRDVVCVVDNLAFLATTDPNKEFTILDISDLDAIAEYAYLNFPQQASGADFAENHVFISIRSNDSLRIITSSP